MRILYIIILSFITHFLLFTEGSAKKLPYMNLRATDGHSVNLSEISNDGKPIIICFFALWCKPCLRELSAIAEVYEEWQKETGVMLVAVSIDDARSTDKVRAEVNAREFPWAVLLDPNSDLKRAMRINTIPYTLVLDGQGEIVWQHNAYVDGSEAEILQHVKEILKR